jgi:hypothetical protein
MNQGERPLSKYEEPERRFINQIKNDTLELFNYDDFGVLMSVQGVAESSSRMTLPSWSLVQKAGEDSTEVQLDHAAMDGLTRDELLGGILVTTMFLQVWHNKVCAFADLLASGLEQMGELSKAKDCEEQVEILIKETERKLTQCKG